MSDDRLAIEDPGMCDECYEAGCMSDGLSCNCWCHPKQCPDCRGEGYLTVTHYVTKEMAMDAGEPAMEGMPVEHTVTCGQCGGHGRVITEASTPQKEAG